VNWGMWYNNLQKYFGKTFLLTSTPPQNWQNVHS